MKDRLIFLQCIGKMLETERMDCSFSCPPPVDRGFWEEIVGELRSDDSETMEEIAAVLRSGASDFDCVEQIALLLERRGFETGGCHDFG